MDIDLPPHAVLPITTLCCLLCLDDVLPCFMWYASGGM